MAKYNAWQNRAQITAADTLDAAELTVDRGTFFGSILRTFSHLYWGDAMWMHRFHGTERPALSVDESPRLVADWSELKSKRMALDTTIQSWAEAIDEAWLASDTRLGRRSMNNGLLVTHFFNHQTHHRGQINAMLTAAGAQLERTDLIVMPS